MSKQALSELLAKVEAGEWDFRADAPARQVFPYQSASAHDLGLTARAAFEGSIDATKSLHDALLPGWRVKMDQSDIIGDDPTFTVSVWPSDATRRESVFRPAGRHADPARAWLIAILKALIAEGE